MAKGRFITGLAELDAALAQLRVSTANKIAKSAIRAGMKVYTKAMQDAAKGGIKQAIGSKFKSLARGRRIEAKAGINVGKAGKAARENANKRAPHAHIHVIGSKLRKRKRLGGRFAYIKKPTNRQLSTGTSPPNPIIKNAVSSSQSQAASAMEAAAKKALEREAARLRRKAGK